MNKLIGFFCILLLIGCKKEQHEKLKTPDYVIVSGQVINRISDSLSIYKGFDFKKNLKINNQGYFKDTIKLKSPDVYGFYDGKNGTFLYLEKGKDLNINFDANNFDNSVIFEGENAINSKYMLDKTILEENLLNTYSLSDFTKSQLNIKLKEISNELNSFYTKNDKIDTVLVHQAQKSLKFLIKGYHDFVDEKINLKNDLPKGSKSPSFKDFEDNLGNKVSLSDFKGKYVYINFWASWCEPCFNEFSALEELIDEYKDKNIEFIGMSINDGSFHDNSLPKAKEAWINKIEELNLTNTQLIIPNGKATKFIRAYRITGIPIYLIIDPDGNIVTPYAPNPSNKELKKLLNNLNL